MFSFAARMMRCRSAMLSAQLAKRLFTSLPVVLLDKAKPPGSSNGTDGNTAGDAVTPIEKKKLKRAHAGKRTLKFYKSLSYKECIDHIRPYMLFEMYIANEKLNMDENCVSKDLEKFRDSAPRIMWKGKYYNGMCNTFINEDSQSIAHEWRRSVYHYVFLPRQKRYSTYLFYAKNETTLTQYYVRESIIRFLYSFVPNLELRYNCEMRMQFRGVLYLLDNALVYSGYPFKSMDTVINRLALNRTDEELEVFNGAFVKGSESVCYPISDDVVESSEERKELAATIVGMLTLQKPWHTIMIDGEKGSGKSHLGMYTAKIAFPNRPATGSTGKDGENWRKRAERTLTIVTKIYPEMRGLTELETYLKRIKNKVDNTMVHVEEYKMKMKESSCTKRRADLQSEHDHLMVCINDMERDRSAAVTQFLCMHMCEACHLSKNAHAFLSRKKNKEISGKYFETTIYVLDDLIASPLLKNFLDGEFPLFLFEINIALFFGKIFIVGCTTRNRSAISAPAVSSPRYWAIDMQPSKTLFKDVLNKDSLYHLCSQSVFMHMVDNRGFAVTAAACVKEVSLHDTVKDTWNLFSVGAVEKFASLNLF
ncbi:hypothetical protein STCU_11071 [Strigomonas culicis]|uniref:Uncharacterized protein n=1 Tax=Strigomonas culicis TaxID=28005 RepID=S9UPX1_9TRYP|nr:hypothetical protein STCU_11071 [Strigomonas culicis]|eukprot:EPY16666.1 hypothetical protein STCU_11071 [Strigomonas culicis]